jgi:hypothetical protein
MADCPWTPDCPCESDDEEPEERKPREVEQPLGASQWPADTPQNPPVRQRRHVRPKNGQPVAKSQSEADTAQVLHAADAGLNLTGTAEPDSRA